MHANSLTFVIFGATGDLTSRKLIPALYQITRRGKLAQEVRIVGASRTVHSDEAWRALLKQSTQQFVGRDFDETAWQALAARIYYQPTDIQNADDFARLAARCDELEKGGPSTRVYYLATAPQLYAKAIAQLDAAGFADEQRGKRRIVVEKPFGTDLQSARELNARIHAVFDEGQIFRIDHYLGKETVQNLTVLRFANSIFEPLWNCHYVDHVQITVAEEVEVGQRGGYYDRSGVLRDMFQNHLLQLLTITAMEAPVQFEADAIRDEKVKVLRAVRPFNPASSAETTFRGQYQGYCDSEGVAPQSQTETFAAVRLMVDNWRWHGVPFYLRSGKAMSCRSTQIVVQFRRPPQVLFGNQTRLDGNLLVIQIQPAEGIQLHFHTKVPDAGLRMRWTDLNVDFQREFAGEMPDAYQRLLLDAAAGDASLFARGDEVELAWSIIDPIAEAWRTDGAPPLCHYETGLWGPLECTDWMHAQGRAWFDVCPVLT